MRISQIVFYCFIALRIVFASSAQSDFSFCRSEATLPNHRILIFSDSVDKETLSKLIDNKCSFSIEGVKQPAFLINGIEDIAEAKDMSTRIYLQGRGEKLLHIVYTFIAKIAKFCFGILIVLLGWIYHALAQFGFIGIIIGGLICLGLGIQLGAGILVLWGGSVAISAVLIYVCIGIHNLFTLNPDYLIEKDFSKDSIIRVIYAQNVYENKNSEQGLFDEIKLDIQNIGLELQKTFLGKQAS